MPTFTTECVEDFPEEPALFQQQMLPLVSRTFALTIPQLPDELASVVANAYLLCRIADTVEDDPGLSGESKSRAHAQFVAALESGADTNGFGARVAASLSPETPVAERLLVRRAGRVIALTRQFRPAQREALIECVRVMCRGMGEYQRNAGAAGLPDTAALDAYCYYVAGVVGEMLTELFIDHCAAVEPGRARLVTLAPSFGEGLQLTNILKDLWDDRRRGACWMPRDRFARHGIDVSALEAAHGTAGFERALRELIALAHGHLRNALEYTLTIPRSEVGVRRFCLWAIGMAMLTLRRIDRNPAYTSGAEVKIPRYQVRAVVMAANGAARSDRMLGWLFSGLAAGLPYHEATAVVPERSGRGSPAAINDETRELP